MERIAIVLGSTGLIGHELTLKLLKDPHFDRVRILVRRKVEDYFPDPPPKLEIQLIDFRDLGALRQHLQGEVIFSCIGTTLQKVHFKQSIYRSIDYDIPLNAAKVGHSLGVKRFFLISTVGANPAASQFYLKLKGELEHDLQLIPFESLVILRPSFLMGKRKAFRWVDQIAPFLIPIFQPLLRGKWEKYRPIQSRLIVQAILNLNNSKIAGLTILEWKQIMEWSINS
ncbi:MAG: NAD(P)H-binding protein [Chitinophagaceae bacterium]